MNRDDLSEEEYASRRAAAIEYQNKRRFSNIFVLLSNLFLIVETLIIIFALTIPVFFILSRCNVNVYGQGGGILLGFLLMVVFVVGLVLGFIVFRKVINVIIRKRHLEGKLTDSVKKHYLQKTKAEKEMELKK